MKEIIGQRIKDERTRQGFSQDELIQEAHLDWDHQTLSNIEKGTRDVKAWELAKLASALKVEVGFFLPNSEKKTQPYVLWRKQPDESVRAEADFIRRCRDYHLVENLTHLDKTVFSEFPEVKIDLERFSFQNAYQLANKIRSEFGLGERPASNLVRTLEERFGLKFFFRDLDGHGSAASCRSSEFGMAILVSASEAPWRQHFSVAHELFHILTWDENLFQQITKSETLWKKNESLADAFAAGLLVPEDSLRMQIQQLSKESKLSDSSVATIARHFEVSLEALLRRMANLKIIEWNVMETALNDDGLKKMDRLIKSQTSTTDYTLSNRFLKLAYLAFEEGNLSKARFAKMLDASIPDIPLILQKYGYMELLDHEISLTDS